MTRRRHVLLLLLLVGAWLSVQLGIKPWGSTYSTQPLGARAFHLLLEKLGVQVKPWLHPFDALDAKERGAVLFVVSPSRMGQEEALIKWVEAGNRLVLLDSPTGKSQSLFRALGLIPVDAKTTLTSRVGEVGKEALAVDCEPSEPEVCKNVRSISHPGTFAGHELPGAQTIAGTSHGPAVLKLPRAQGEVWLIAGNTPVLNMNIDRYDNLRFLFQLATQSRTVLFDEFHHGYVAPADAQGRARSDALWLFAAVLLAALIIGALSRSIRLGPPLEAPLESRSGLVEFASVMGLLCQEHKATSLLRQYLAAWKTRCEQRFGVPRQPGPQELLADLAQRNLLRQEQLPQLRAAVETLASAQAREEKRATEAVRELETLLEAPAQ